jgi:hypothetical protein
MVESMFGFVASHMQNGQFPMQFKSAFEKIPHSFEAMSKFVDSYVKENGLNIPFKLDLVPQSAKPVGNTKGSCECEWAVSATKGIQWTTRQQKCDCIKPPVSSISAIQTR